MDEVWKQLDHFPDYYISSGGRVIDLHKGHLMATITDGYYEYVKLHKYHRAYTLRVDILMAQYFG